MSDFVHGDTDLVLAPRNRSRAIIQEWVMQLPFRHQGVLILALRGPDGAKKESTSRGLLRVLRGLIMICGRTGSPMHCDIEGGEYYPSDNFMRTDLIMQEHLWRVVVEQFMSEFDSYNIHFLQHLLHACAIVGKDHWNGIVRDRMWSFYCEGVRKLHMYPETPKQLSHRLRDGIRSEEDE